jgi:hypothetical protein
LSPKDWLNRFLESKGLAKADGRPLYRYRMAEQEDKIAHDLRFVCKSSRVMENSGLTARGNNKKLQLGN